MGIDPHKTGFDKFIGDNARFLIGYPTRSEELPT
jgi:hypothetical protein